MQFQLDPTALSVPYRYPINSKLADAIEAQATRQGFDRPMVAVWSDGWFLTAWYAGEYVEYALPSTLPPPVAAGTEYQRIDSQIAHSRLEQIEARLERIEAHLFRQKTEA